MAVIEKLTEEEMALFAILSDPSGLDQAEFLWHAPEHEETHGCWRAWDFQHPWFRCMDQKTIDQCARSVGKSLSIAIRACAFPLLYAGEELLITAPEGNFLDSITDLIETKLTSTKLYTELLKKTAASNGIKHRPFHVNYKNNSRMMGRLPQRDGRGVKGQHPLWVEQDEASDYPEKGWVELAPAFKADKPGSRWLAHGVTLGIRDKFYEFSQPGSGWTVHQIPAMARPTWTARERQLAVDSYDHSDRSPDFRRNVYGMHGDIANFLFVLARLLRCVDLKPDSPYNQEFYFADLSYEETESAEGDIFRTFDLPLSHKTYKTCWGGADIGLTADPSEFLIFAEEEADVEGGTVLKLITRLSLRRVSAPDQRKVIMHLIDFYNLQAFSMDSTGIGLPIYQELQEMAKSGDALADKSIHIIKPYNFGQNILVDFDDSIDLEEFDGELVKDAGIYRKVLEASSDKLREYVDNKRLKLPDNDIVREFQGETYQLKPGMNAYGKKVYNNSKGHAMDAARMAILGHAQFEIDKFMRSYKAVTKQEPVIDIFL
jgi:hypothetical protein